VKICDDSKWLPMKAKKQKTKKNIPVKITFTDKWFQEFLKNFRKQTIDADNDYKSVMTIANIVLWVSEWLPLTLTQQFFSYIMVRTS